MVTTEVLTGFSLSVSGTTPTVVLTATMQVDSVSAADFLEATLQNTVYKSALLSPHNLAVNVSYEFAGLSITAHTLQSGASGALVQVVLAAKSVQVVLAPKFGGEGWTATAAQFEAQNGQRYTYNCPVPGPRDDVSGNNVWGTTTYTDDSSVCAAAVNYGLITIKAGGTVTIQIESGAKSYTGSNRNGTTTESSGPSTGSFVFIGQPIYNTDVGYGGRGWDAYPSSFPAKNGQRYLYICPPKGGPEEIFGTGTYTTDSPVCTAAVQEGLITFAKGGNVTIEIEPGIGTYTGSTKNGVTSISGSWSYGSYVFVTTLQPVA
ncbi:MAG: LCCL domain-containing protein [Acidimicrobiales bacterium]|jgi:hypothetical protein